jgi:hypothetical protein
MWRQPPFECAQGGSQLSTEDRDNQKKTGLRPVDSRGRPSPHAELLDLNIAGSGLDFYRDAAAADFAADFFLAD